MFHGKLDWILDEHDHMVPHQNKYLDSGGIIPLHSYWLTGLFLLLVNHVLLLVKI